MTLWWWRKTSFPSHSIYKTKMNLSQNWIIEMKWHTMSRQSSEQWALINTIVIAAQISKFNERWFTTDVIGFRAVLFMCSFFIAIICVNQLFYLWKKELLFLYFQSSVLLSTEIYLHHLTCKEIQKSCLWIVIRSSWNVNGVKEPFKTMAKNFNFIPFLFPCLNKPSFLLICIYSRYSSYSVRIQSFQLLYDLRMGV